jgi:hypothetical protein
MHALVEAAHGDQSILSEDPEEHRLRFGRRRLGEVEG